MAKGSFLLTSDGYFSVWQYNVFSFTHQRTSCFKFCNYEQTFCELFHTGWVNTMAQDCFVKRLSGLPNMSPSYPAGEPLEHPPSLESLSVFSYLLIYCAGKVEGCMPPHTCGSQSTTCRSQFSPSTTWVVEIELRSSDLVTSALDQ
jgi:hypothetical protein